MKATISVFTVGVDDLEASLRFYRDGLGLPTEGIIGREFEHGAVAFFELQPGLKFAIFSRGDIAHDAGIPKTPRSATEFTIGHNVASEAEVDAVMKQAIDAGARLVKPAQKTFWGGYSGYFQDPDDHLWEVVFNPAFLPPQFPQFRSFGDRSFGGVSGTGVSGTGVSGDRSFGDRHDDSENQRFYRSHVHCPTCLALHA